MGLLDVVHARTVYGRRIDVLCTHLAEMLPRSSRVLDIGCGDGKLDAILGKRRPDLTIDGLDVLVRPKTFVPVTPFDGRTVPHPDRSYDAVMFVDVLHHTIDPRVLLAEAGRVARRCVVVKDHVRDGFLAESTLRFMDWVGNERHGVALHYNYWSRAQWIEVFSDLRLTVAEERHDLRLYSRPADILFGRSLHLLARLDVEG